MMLFILHDEARRKFCLDYLSAINLKSGLYEVVVRPHKKKRSNSQNRIYWAWIDTIAQSTGDEKDDLHETIKAEFLGFRDVKVLGKVRVLPKSTASLSVQEMTNLLRKVEMLAKSLGIPLPYPDDFSYAMGERNEN